MLLLALWIGVNRTSWLGPAIADGLRAVFGARFVAWLEDVAYDAQDRFNQWRYRDAAPKTYWEPSPAPVAAAEPSPAASAEEKPPPAYRPEPFEPPFPKVAAEGDGAWLPIEDPEGGAPVMFKAQVHPDPRRGFAALALVAFERTAFDLHLVAGTSEPESPKVPRKDRHGLIAADHQAGLFAAFNGGFKATHGQYGMLLDGIEYLPPRDFACTFVQYRDRTLAIGTWSNLKSGGIDSMRFYRQTPPCLVEDGEVHTQLVYHEYAKGWGATVSGETVIRRSAIGIDREGKTVFYGIGDAMTAQALARGMKAAGAHAAAELDVNYSYPRFIFYSTPDPAKPPLATSAIIPGLEYTPDLYVTRPSTRDFFYLVRAKRKRAAIDSALRGASEG